MDVSNYHDAKKEEDTIDFVILPGRPRTEKPDPELVILRYTTRVRAILAKEKRTASKSKLLEMVGTLEGRERLKKIVFDLMYPYRGTYCCYWHKKLLRRVAKKLGISYTNFDGNVIKMILEELFSEGRVEKRIVGKKTLYCVRKV